MSILALVVALFVVVCFVFCAIVTIAGEGRPLPTIPQIPRASSAIPFNGIKGEGVTQDPPRARPTPVMALPAIPSPVPTLPGMPAIIARTSPPQIVESSPSPARNTLKGMFAIFPPREDVEIVTPRGDLPRDKRGRFLPRWKG